MKVLRVFNSLRMSTTRWPASPHWRTSQSSRKDSAPVARTREVVVALAGEVVLDVLRLVGLETRRHRHQGSVEQAVKLRAGLDGIVEIDPNAPPAHPRDAWQQGAFERVYPRRPSSSRDRLLSAATAPMVVTPSPVAYSTASGSSPASLWKSVHQARPGLAAPLEALLERLVEQLRVLGPYAMPQRAGGEVVFAEVVVDQHLVEHGVFEWTVDHHPCLPGEP